MNALLIKDTDVKTIKLILASSSPRRKQLLAEAGYEFAVIAPPLPEPNEVIDKLAPVHRAESLAYFKARSVADNNPDAMVLGADTVVAVGGSVLGKPIDADDARKMLQTLSGSRHQVITSLALLGPSSSRIIASEITWVTMRKMTDAEIEQYIASGEWRDKAGAYAIQETADRFIVKVEGSFSNVVGLPLELVGRMIRELTQSPQAHKLI